MQLPWKIDLQLKSINRSEPYKWPASKNTPIFRSGSLIRPVSINFPKAQQKAHIQSILGIYIYMELGSHISLSSLALSLLPHGTHHTRRCSGPSSLLSPSLRAMVEGRPSLAARPHGMAVTWPHSDPTSWCSNTAA